MTVVDLHLQKTDQSAHVPFEHEFKVGSMSLHDGDRQVFTHTHVENQDLGPRCAGLYWHLCTDPLHSWERRARGKCSDRERSSGNDRRYLVESIEISLEDLRHVHD